MGGGLNIGGGPAAVPGTTRTAEQKQTYTMLVLDGQTGALLIGASG